MHLNLLIILDKGIDDALVDQIVFIIELLKMWLR